MCVLNNWVLVNVIGKYFCIKIIILKSEIQ